MSYFMYCVEILIIIAILLFKFIGTRKPITNLAGELPGPKTYPIIGNALMFWCKDEDIFQKMIDCIERYPSPMRFWNGSKLYIIFSKAIQVEKIFSSTAFSTKDDIYKFIKYFNGEGLISSSGSKWKKDRRLMCPLFLKRNILQYFPVILKHTNILVNVLKEKIDSPTFDIECYICKACTDFVNESLLGLKSKNQGRKNDAYFAKICKTHELIHRRIIKPWLQIDYLYKFSLSYMKQKEAKDMIHGFFYKILIETKKSHRHLGQKDTNFRTVLEQLLDIRDEITDFATDEEILDHLVTLYSASEHTVTNTCCFALVLLGMYPEYQQKVAEEIQNVVGFTNGIEEQHLDKLDYLEMVIKEVLRLFPIVPFIVRQASQDTKLDEIHISNGSSVMVSIYNIHRDPSQWEKPNNFYPEHFLPQAIENRHPYAYVPFSAGLRGCIGKPYAYMAIKILLVTILQKYIIEADGNLQDKNLTADFSLRFKERMFPIRVKCRV